MRQAGSSRQEAPAQGTSAIVIEHFPILRTPTEPIPARASEALGMMRRTVWANRSQFVAMSGLRVAFWMVPGPGRLCMVRVAVEEAPGEVCVSNMSALEHGVTMATVANNRERRVVGDPRLIIGLMPVGTQAAKILTGRTNITVPVHHDLLIHRDSQLRPPDEIRPLAQGGDWLRSEEPRRRTR